MATDGHNPIGMARQELGPLGLDQRGAVVTQGLEGTDEHCVGGDLFHWPAGHSVRVEEDAEVILFSPQKEHTEVLEHMIATMSAP